jgi:hypothetical protein
MQLRGRRTPQIAALCAPADRDERNRRNSNLASCSPAYSAWAIHLYYLGRNIIRFLRSVAMPKCLPVPPTISGHAGISYRINLVKSQDRAPRLCHARAGRRPGVGIAGGSAKKREKQRRDGGTSPKERGAARCSFNGLGSWMPGTLGAGWREPVGRAKTNIQPLPIATRDKARLGRARKGWDSHNLRPIASRRAGCHNRV